MLVPVQHEMFVVLTTQVLDKTKSSARGLFNSVVDVDRLRPYFDVETRQVLRRIGMAFVPLRRKTDEPEQAELYGPSMIVLTMVALITFCADDALVRQPLVSVCAVSGCSLHGHCREEAQLWA